VTAIDGAAHFELLRAEYLEQPHEVSIETQTVCNAACVFCPYPRLERKGTKMTDELLYGLLDQMRGWKPFLLSPFKVSDPLLEPRLDAILGYVNRHIPQAEIRIFTNGSALTHRQAEMLHRAENLTLYVSLNSHRPDEYEATMGLKWERTKRNLDMLHDSDFRHPVHVLRVGRDPAFTAYVWQQWPAFQPIQVKREPGMVHGERRGM